MIAWDVDLHARRTTNGRYLADGQAKERNTVQLRFELGDSAAPRGHAILYARLSASGPDRYIATYCVVLPIAFSMAKYLPPMLSGQIPPEALGGMGEGISVVPIPPMLEDVPDLDELRATAERRDDDLCDLGTLLLSDDSQRLLYGTQASQEYAQLYARYRERWPRTPTPSPASPEPAPMDEVDVDAVVAAILPERARLTEMARLISQARYAIDVHDTHALDTASRDLQRLARSLPEKYRADRLAQAALRTDTTGPRLAELYLQRAFKLADEDYINIPPLDQQIRTLEGEDDPIPGSAPE
jgi:hypothetical protein